MSGGRSGSMQLLCGLAILAALGAVLAWASASGEGRSVGVAAEPGAIAALDREQLARISVAATPRVARRVERIRELEFERVPRPQVVSSGFLNRLGVRERRRSGESLELGADEAAARITGLLQPDEQLEPAFTSTGDLAAAAYDTRRDRLYVVEDAAAANRALVEFLLAHELTHALEDQRFGLPEAIGVNDDGVLAELALAEGTATAVMIEYGASHLGALELLAGSSAIEPSTGEVPKFVVDQLLWAYLGGNRFVAELRRLAGGWTLVDYALDSRPPASTEQVVHARKYVRDERPRPVRIDARELRARGWRLSDRGALGELATFHLLQLGGDAQAARLAAAGWGGDRFELWRQGASPRGCHHPCRRELVLALRWRWDSSADAREFASAAATYLEDGLGGQAAGDGTWKLEDGSATLRAASREAALVFAPDAATARAVAAEQAPASG